MAECRALIRMVWRNRASALAAVVMMGCALAATAATFAIADAALWRSLPYRDAHRLLLLTTAHAQGEVRVSLPDFVAARRAIGPARVAASGAYTPELSLTGFGAPRQIRARVLSANYFSVLGVPLAAGRDFTEQEEVPGSGAVTIISDAVRRELFDSRDPLGTTLFMNGRAHTIVGILPPFPDFLGKVDVYIPYQFSPALPRKIRLLAPIVRLDDPAHFDMTRAQLEVLSAASGDPDAAGYTLTPVWLHERVAEASRSRATLLFAAALALMAIAVLNFTMLMAARARQRQVEFATRLAVGASRLDILRLAAMEAALLCGAAAGLAHLLAGMLVPIITRLYGPGLVNEVHLGWRVLFLTGVISAAVIAAAVLAVSGPVQRLSHPSRTVVVSRFSAGRTLVVAQLALSLVLLVASALLVRAFVAQQRTDPGFTTANRHTTRIALPGTKYRDAEARTLFWRNLLERLERAGVPAAITTELPLTGEDNAANFIVTLGDGGRMPVKLRSVSPGYLDSMSVPTLEGRGLARTDRIGAPVVVVVNERLASRLEQLGPPVGQIVTLDVGNGPLPVRVVGIAGNVRHESLAAEPAPEIYASFEQTPLGTYSLVLSSERDAREVSRVFRDTLDTIDADQPFTPIVPFAAHIERSLAGARVQAELLGGFAAAAVVVSASGVYSLFTFLLTATRREWAVRLAIGAAPRDLQRAVIAQALGYALRGAAFGVFLLVVLAPVLRALRPDAAAWDPLIVSGAAILLAAVSVAAAALPARRLSGMSALECLQSGP